MRLTARLPRAAKVVDLSAGGFSFVSTVPPGSFSTVQLTFVTEGRRGVGTGSIVWSRESGAHGVQWIELNDAAKDFISALGAVKGHARPALFARVRRVRVEPVAPH